MKKMKLQNIKSFICTECNEEFDVDTSTEYYNIIMYGMCSHCWNRKLKDIENVFNKLIEPLYLIIDRLVEWLNLKLK